MQKLISIDLKSNFGFFRKPDMNNTINLSYNMLHKPALLGILGAIIGLEGYQQLGKTPEYYEKLKDVKVGIAPLEHEKGNFQKTAIKYSNTVGYANKGATYLTEEATLIAPAYRCYLLLDMENELHTMLYNYLKEGKAEYLPYFGKNEFYAWWDTDSFQTFSVVKFDKNINYKVVSLICMDDKQEDSIKSAIAKSMVNGRTKSNQPAPFIYFERLPVDLNSAGYGDLKKLVYSNVTLDKENNLELSDLYIIDNNSIIHLF